MKFGKVTLGAAAAVAAMTPIAGQAIASERVAAPVEGESEIGGGPIGLLIILALVGIAIGVAAGSDDEPNSP